MAAQTLTIKSGDDFYSQLMKYLSDESYLVDKRLTIPEKLQKISIHFTGTSFNSSMPSSIMRGFIELQQAIYSVYSYHVYGERRRLSSGERKALELNVIVSEGSSWYEVLLGDIVKAIAERVKKMTGKEILSLAALLCFAYFATTIGSKAIDRHTEIARLQEMRQTVTDTQKNTVDAMIEAMETQQTFYRSFSGQEFDSLEINGQNITPKELQDMTKISREKHPVEEKIYRGDYRVTDVHFENETVYLDVVNSSTAQSLKYVNILAEQISEDDFQWFKDSANGQTIEMTIVATEKNGIVLASYLQNFKK